MIITGVLVPLLLIYGVSGILYAYVYSFFQNDFTSSLKLFIVMNNVLGC